MKTIENSLRLAHTDVVAFRLKVITHGTKYGVKSACDAFGVSRASYFRWQKKFKESNKKLASLVPQKTRPQQVRRMTTDYRLVAFITDFRKQYGNIGREKIKPFLDQYALELGINSLSYRTIGKVIQRRQLFEDPPKQRRKVKLIKNRSKYAPKVTTVGFVEVDCVTLYVLNQRHCFVCCIDVLSKIALVKKVKTLSSLNTRDTLVDFINSLPFPIHTVQTDNGSEFLSAFDDYLTKLEITHQFTYPHCPRTNGVVERFNRTIQEEFLNRSSSLVYDLDRFYVKLTKWLDWYNTSHPHAALGYLSPLQFYQTKVSKVGA
jgi:putative transposase